MEKNLKLNGTVHPFNIFIPYNTPSLKNSKQWTGKHLIASKSVRDYIALTKKDYEDNRIKWLEMIKDKQPPYFLGLHFYRKSRHKFDFINACQIVQDLMVKYGWVEDDNMDFIIPVCLCYTEDNQIKGYTYNKDNPGVEITVL